MELSTPRYKPKRNESRDADIFTTILIAALFRTAKNRHKSSVHQQIGMDKPSVVYT